MYNTLKILLLLLVSFLFSKTSLAQEKIKLYFLADTINISPESRILDIGDEGPYHGFLFFCKCIPGSKRPPSFTYRIDRDPGEITVEKPPYQYISWKDLSEIFHQGRLKFTLKYDLYITELLPDKKFKTNKVSFVRVRGEIDQ